MVVTLGCGDRAAQRDAAPANPTPPVDRDAALANLTAQVEAQRQAALQEDYAKLAALTHPAVVETMGGHQKFAEQLGAFAAEFKARGNRIVSVKIFKPLDYVESSGELYSIIRQELEEIGPGGARTRARTYLIGVSADRGATWKFLDGQGIGADRRKLNLVLPRFPGDLPLPAEFVLPKFPKDLPLPEVRESKPGRS